MHLYAAPLLAHCPFDEHEIGQVLGDHGCPGQPAPHCRSGRSRQPGVRLVRRPEGAGAPRLVRHVLDAAKIRLERLTVVAPPAVTESKLAVAILDGKAMPGSPYAPLRIISAWISSRCAGSASFSRSGAAIISSRRCRNCWASPARWTSPRRRRCLAATISVGSAASVTMPDGAVAEEPSDPAAGRRHPPATRSTRFLTNRATI